MKKLLPFLILLAGCSTTAKQNVTAAYPTVMAVADLALGASGYGSAAPAFNALSGMALALYQGNNPVAASGNPDIAKAVLAAFPTATPATLNAAAATLPVP